MKRFPTRATCILATIAASAVLWLGGATVRGATAGEKPKAAPAAEKPKTAAAAEKPKTAAAASYEAQQQAVAKEREQNPAWQPVREELAVIRVAKENEAGSLANFCVNTDGNLLACWSGAKGQPAPQGDAAPAGGEIRIHAPTGALLKSIPLPITPSAICVDAEGTIYVGGGGRLLKLDQQGKVLLAADTPAARGPATPGKEMQEMLKQSGMNEEQMKRNLEAYQRTLEQRRGDVTGLAVTKQDVFVASPSPDDFGYSVYRVDHQFANPQLMVGKLRGCCNQMDVQAAGDKLWIPHNARHRVECLDRDGKPLAAFGTAGRVKPEHFGGCCEPKNLRVTPAGDLLAAESGPPTCIKRFKADGTFVEVVAVVKGDGNCVRVTVDQSPDGKQFYLLDTARNSIRVFGSKAS